MQYIEILKRSCSNEIDSYDEHLKEQIVVGGVVSTFVWVSHYILQKILIAAKRGESLVSFATRRKKTEEDKLVDAIVEKFRMNGGGELVATKTTTFRLGYARERKGVGRGRERRRQGVQVKKQR